MTTERQRERVKRFWMCGRKARYQSRQIAESSLYLLRANGKERGVQHVYQCPHGEHFHIGRMQTGGK